MPQGRHALSAAGFTLVEVLVAALVLSVAVLGTLALMDRSGAAATTARDREMATSLTRELIEAARAVPYPEVSTGGLRRVAAARAGLANAKTPTYLIRHAGTTFTISLKACTFDDAADGGGSHAAGSFCAGSAAAGTADANAEDYKVITATTTWKRRVKRSVVQRTIVNDSGSTTAPAVTSLAVRGMASPPPPVTSASSLTFDFATSVAATPVWRVDGVARTPAATGNGRAFSATWSLTDVEDGVYSVSVQGLDAAGRAGVARSLSITLNRSAPAAPLGLTAVRDGSVVELAWQPSPERDVVGYTVYRRDGSRLVAICTGEPETACTDPAPGRPARYVVVALDVDAAGAPREGAASEEAHAA